MNYKTPGVYIEEVSLLPPSIAQVETAIPAFIGYTEKAIDPDGNSLSGTPTRIQSMVDYRRFFGGAAPQSFKITLAGQIPFSPLKAELISKTPYKMYHALEMFYANGGGPCYIVSVGDYDNQTVEPSLDEVEDYKELKSGLDSLRQVDEVTLLVVPDAHFLKKEDYHTLYKDMLIQCADTQDRFAIFDVKANEEKAIDAFRDNIGTSNLKYGATYFPNLISTLNYNYDPKTVIFVHSVADAFDSLSWSAAQELSDAKELKRLADPLKSELDDLIDPAIPTTVTKEEKENAFTGASLLIKKLLEKVDELVALSKNDTAINTLKDISNEVDAILNSNPSTKADFTTAITNLKSQAGNAIDLIDPAIENVRTKNGISPASATAIAQHFTNAFTSRIKVLIGEHRVVMPPSSAMAGIYATVDRTRGVWKAPANISLNSVVGPEVKITHDEQKDLNIHTTGISINAIRAFSGKGTLAWGARTLAGNDNEWRYISVRRFFNMVEESTKKASAQFVFENNNAGTWVKVKGMIKNYLTTLWRQGALMGSTPEEAFFVNVGLNETMTDLDIYEGRMIVEIGLAVVRPAEFIILRFSHKMPES